MTLKAVISRFNVLDFTIAFDLYIFLSDRNASFSFFASLIAACRSNSKPSRAIFKMLKLALPGAELKIKAYVSTGFKDFHIVINHHGDGSVFR